MRPNCICGHGYEKHGWGTTGCEICTDHCHAYRQSFCECKHVWDVHGVVDGNPAELACPFCGKTCKHWRKLMEDADTKPPKTIQKICECGHKEEDHDDECVQIIDETTDCKCKGFKQKSPENGQKLDKLCVCGHKFSNHGLLGINKCLPKEENCSCTKFEELQNVQIVEKPAKEKLCAICGHSESMHFAGGQYCRGCIHDHSLKLEECCRKFTEIIVDKSCKCGHAESEHDSGEDHSWCDGCLKTPNLPVPDCCKKFEVSAYQDSEQDYPDCVCGHNYWMHGITGKENDEECTECFEDNNIPLATVCKKYRPKTDEATDDFGKANSAALSQINSGTVPKVQPYSNSYSQGTLYTHCDHPPFKAFADKGMEIWCGTKSEVIGFDAKPCLTDFDVILNCAKSGSVLPHHKIPMAFGKKYTTKSQEIEIDWPDMGAPLLAATFWRDLYNYLKSTKGKMLIFCVGGHGRTGTALACMLVAARWKHRDAKNWIWKNYCKKAIETKTQEKYIAAVETSLAELKASKKKK